MVHALGALRQGILRIVHVGNAVEKNPGDVAVTALGGVFRLRPALVCAWIRILIHVEGKRASFCART
jgi:hypothetical protein